MVAGRERKRQTDIWILFPLAYMVIFSQILESIWNHLKPLALTRTKQNKQNLGKIKTHLLTFLYLQESPK